MISIVFDADRCGALNFDIKLFPRLAVSVLSMVHSPSGSKTPLKGRFLGRLAGGVATKVTEAS